VQFAYFVGNIDAEEVMNLKSSQRFRDHCWAENTRDAPPVPEVSAKSVKEAPFIPAFPALACDKLVVFGRASANWHASCFFKIRLPGEPENHPLCCA
jgi:hypothetical protein